MSWEHRLGAGDDRLGEWPRAPLAQLVLSVFVEEEY